jgi:hypothetical protein
MIIQKAVYKKGKGGCKKIFVKEQKSVDISDFM